MLHRRFRVVGAIALAFALIAAACGDDPEEEGAGSDTSTPTEESSPAAEPIDYKACLVTDASGIDDKSFNQTAYTGLVRAEGDLGIDVAYVESTAATDYEPNIANFMDDGCDMIVTVGFLLGDATAKAAAANPEQQFTIVDNDLFDVPNNKDLTFDNVRELTFNTDQAAFLAGYVAASTTETGKVGTFGGKNLPTVTIFMEGMRLGIEQYNEDFGTAVELVGWDGTDGLFTGDFDDQDKGRTSVESLIDEGADIIMPVAGRVGLPAPDIARANPGVKLIWVDVDGCMSLPDDCDLFLTTVAKNMDTAVFDTVAADVDGTFEGGLYIGTLENEGVELSPFHEFDDEVTQEVKDKVEEYQEQIISGEYVLGG